MNFINIRYYVAITVIGLLIIVFDRPVLAIVFALMTIIYYLDCLTRILIADKNINVTFRKKGDQNERTER